MVYLAAASCQMEAGAQVRVGDVGAAAVLNHHLNQLQLAVAPRLAQVHTMFTECSLNVH
jgi:hypothetical protein